MQRAVLQLQPRFCNCNREVLRCNSRFQMHSAGPPPKGGWGSVWLGCNSRLQLHSAGLPPKGGLGVRMARLQFQIAVALCRPSAQGGGVEHHINTQMKPITVIKVLECRTGCECCRFSITFQMMQVPLLTRHIETHIPRSVVSSYSSHNRHKSHARMYARHDRVQRYSIGAPTLWPHARTRSAREPRGRSRGAPTAATHGHIAPPRWIGKSSPPAESSPTSSHSHEIP